MRRFLRAGLDDEKGRLDEGIGEGDEDGFSLL